jgi:peroxiredoxin
MTTTLRRHLASGDSAPNFALPAVNRDGIVALDDYRGKSTLLIGLLRGLHCPFCRRRIVQLGIISDKLAQDGVETVAIVNTSVERARQYFQYRPTRVLLAADQEVRTHRAFGLTRPAPQHHRDQPAHARKHRRTLRARCPQATRASPHRYRPRFLAPC